VLPDGRDGRGRQSAAGKQVTRAFEANEGEKAVTGEEKSVGMVSLPREERTAGLQSSVGVVTAHAQEVQVPPVGPVGQPEAQSEDDEAGSEDLEAESDDYDESFNEESDAADVCEAIQHLIPSNIIALEAMDLLARRERWAPLDEESEIVAFRIIRQFFVGRGADGGTNYPHSDGVQEVGPQQHAVDGQSGTARLISGRSGGSSVEL
jgi:hypothetical protein